MSYQQVLADVSSTLGTSVASAKVIPANWQGSTDLEQFIRVNVFPSASQINGYDTNTISGFVSLNIFVQAGRGSVDAFRIADVIDTLINKKRINNTQFAQSRLNIVGLDSANSNLWRVDYDIDFVNNV